MKIARKLNVSLITVCLIGLISVGSAIPVSAGSQSPKAPLSNDTNSTVFTRSSKVSKTLITETSVKTDIKSVVKKEKNSAKSKSTVDRGTLILTSPADTKLTAKTTVTTSKSLTETTITTTVVTTRVQKYPKAPKSKIKFNFATASDGMSGVPIREALVRLNFKYGYQISLEFIANSDLVIAGGASGQFDMGNSSTSAAMKVIQSGAPIKFIGENIKNTWVLVGKSSIKSCADMNGVRLGLHSAGGVSTALYRSWYKKNCDASIKPKERFIAGSPNRLVALVADQIDVAMMEVEDTLFLPAGFGIISNFSKTLPEIKTGLVWMNENFLTKNQKVASDLMYELTWLAQEMNRDAVFFKKIALKWTTGYADMDKIVSAYQAAKLYPENPEAFFKELDLTAEFFTLAGTLKPGLRADKMAVSFPLKTVVNRLNF